MNKNIPIIPVFVFTCIYLLAAIFFASKALNYEFIIYIGVVVLAVIAVGMLYFKYGLTIGLLWFLSIWGLSHMAGGLLNVPHDWVSPGKVNVLYNVWLIRDLFKFDQAVHAYGFGVATWMLWQIIVSFLAFHIGCPQNMIKPTRGLLFICLFAGAGLGALNEVVEFIATLVLPETNVGGYINTGWDLVFNLVGATVAVIIIRLGRKSQPPA